MIVALIIIAIIFLLFLVIWFTTVSILIDFSHRQDDDHLIIQLIIWKVIRYKIKVPKIKVEQDEPTITFKKETNTGTNEHSEITPEEISDKLADFKELLEHVLGLKTIISKFLKKIKVEQLEWYTTIGLKDAALTGKITGVIWAVKGLLIAFLSMHMNLIQLPTYSVTPSFQIPLSETTLKCMFKLRIGNAILAGLKVFKFWRGGKGSFRTKPLSKVSKEDPGQSI
ncbi:DUF2953 domain-containing protein [Heyndrickxia oleronia]|uniref:DUF2953 domain-containing protein n=1 Tax=Heyndrickxia oleronia TaxID=38875 RepID=A0AAW6ST35_9BACI|nr:DUF2953 domain-containing protein [Heyndrickxia oleronia]MCM3237262.1 DUF2953 domain-containing protein [Heyndrickxia oleronia]MDH5160463.1 DUF2953 domain-containing protein [Heyndrickxia oleronia]